MGTFLGIDLFVHWSFGLLLIFSGVMSAPTGSESMMFAWAILLSAFTCVTLHEYGHAIAAKRYGIGTADITLLPIGGLARLESMPRNPWQEFVVAVAGPAVNVIIAAMILIGLRIGYPSLFESVVALVAACLPMSSLKPGEPSIDVFEAIGGSLWISYLTYMLLINCVLVIFNMIPAFPMDGGRVLRSVLAMMLHYGRATEIASRIGIVIAFLMAFWALTNSAWVPLGVSLFIGYAGLAEAGHVSSMVRFHQIRVRDAMISNIEGVSADRPVGEVLEQWRTEPGLVRVVVGQDNHVFGIVRLESVLKKLEPRPDSNVSPKDDGKRFSLETPVGYFISGQDAANTIEADRWLNDIVPMLGPEDQFLPVVNPQGQLVGGLDLRSARTRKNLGDYLSKLTPKSPQTAVANGDMPAFRPESRGDLGGNASSELES